MVLILGTKFLNMLGQLFAGSTTRILFSYFTRGLLMILFLLQAGSCLIRSDGAGNAGEITLQNRVDSVRLPVRPGAENLAAYVPMLKNKRVAITVNHTSRVGDSHLIDTLLALDIDLVRIFSPEHGFKGTTEAGQEVADGLTGSEMQIPVISLYGKIKKPQTRDLDDIDIMVFDIQDVGARFYTYISTLHYVMEACAENAVPLIVLDRPNPNGHFVDGPILEPDFQSFVGMHPIPVVYGMTIGELAQMINSEGWLVRNLSVDLTVIKNVNYTHNTPYDLPVAPSPNLPDQLSVLLYPSLCFFEGTAISEGRGTPQPFTCIGHPNYTNLSFTFTPIPNAGSKHPKLEGQQCHGYDLSDISAVNFRAKGRIELSWLVEFYRDWKGDGPFFNENGWFDKLAGTDQLRKQIEAGMTPDDIRASWQPALDTFRNIRAKYLLYADFE